MCLPNYVAGTLRDALPIFDRKVRLACPEAVLTGVETRSSSPVRVVRGADYQSGLRGVYPCGEGCGYAGGIVSAARMAFGWRRPSRSLSDKPAEHTTKSTRFLRRSVLY